MLPRICSDLDPLIGTVRRDISDTKVEEVLQKDPSGDGAFLWVLVKHGQISTRQVAASLARSVHVDPKTVTYAATRDRQSEVLQWFSLPAEEIEQPQVLKNAGYKKLFKVQRVEQSKGEISEESIKSLRYTIRIKDAALDSGYLRAKAILDQLRRLGCPNYIGYTRLGPKGQHAKWGKVLWQGKHLPKRIPVTPKDRRQYALAYQCQAFNRFVAERMNKDLLTTCLQGDYLETGLSKPWFQREHAFVDDTEQAQKRLDSWEAVVCGPLIGRNMPENQAEAASFEQQFFSSLKINAAASHAVGARRALRFQPTSIRCDDQKKDLIVNVTLDPSVYVTALLEELLQPERHIL